MDLFEIIIIVLQISESYSRKGKKFLSSSDESIDHFVYFQECSHKKVESTITPVRLRQVITEPPKRQSDYPFPRMCCALTCGNECDNQQSFVSRQMQPIKDVQPPHTGRSQPQVPVQPQAISRGRKKKPKPIKLPPIGARRDFGFTKERIKSLISQDDDIRKILKDLVRVTMQKVDVMEMINANKNSVIPENTAQNTADDYE